MSKTVASERKLPAATSPWNPGKFISHRGLKLPRMRTELGSDATQELDDA